MTKEEIKRLMVKEGLTIEQVIDSVIEVNGIIGVGLVSLAAHLNKYINDKIRNS